MRRRKDVFEELKWIVEGLINQHFSFDSYIINGRRFNTKSLNDRKTNQNSDVSIVTSTMQFSSAKDKNPIYGDMTYYGVVKEIKTLFPFGLVFKSTKLR